MSMPGYREQYPEDEEEERRRDEWDAQFEACSQEHEDWLAQQDQEVVYLDPFFGLPMLESPFGGPDYFYLEFLWELLD